MDAPDIIELDEEVPKIVQEVYDEVWDEFYPWEEEYCRGMLEELHVRNYVPPEIPEFPIQGFYNVTSFDVDLDEDNNAFIIEEYGEASHLNQDGVLAPIASWYTTCVEVKADKFQPYPAYEFCTPASRNVYRNRIDGMSSNVAEFVPYADDKDLDLSIMDNFTSFAWQTEMKNPDVELIALETIRRLYYGRRISFEEIDASGVLPYEVGTGHRMGLLWEVRQRDLLPWPGSELSNLPRIEHYIPPRKEDVFETVNDAIEFFCANLNCLHSVCDTHHGITYSRFRPIQALVTSEEMRQEEGEPCGMHCFRLYDTDEETTNAVKWHPEDVETFKSFLKMIPDAAPCDMAVIMRMPCHEVLVYRTRELPDEQIIENRPSDQPTTIPYVPRRFRDENDDENNVDPESILPPCSHLGICNALSGCECHANEHHCERNCHCDLSCPLRRKGCKCGKSKSKSKTKSKKALCNGENCPCFMERRECDPELCVSCDARGDKSKRCANNVVQRQKYPPLIIKRSQWGLGAFAGSYITEGNIIGEYVGEMVYEADQEAYIDKLAKHTGLNYVFNFEQDISLDSARVGNETRYLNHSQNNNVHAETLTVNGTNRIILRAGRSIRKGEELFLDYGPRYWIHGDPGEAQPEGSSSGSRGSSSSP